MPSQLNGTPSDLLPLPTAVGIASSNGGTPIIVQTSGPHLCVTGDLVQVNGHYVAHEANGQWTCQVVDSTHVILVGSIGTHGAGAATGMLQNLGFGTTFQIPSDGDAANASSVNVSNEALADRTALLAADIGVYSDIGADQAIVSPALPWDSVSAGHWATHTFAAQNTWEAIQATPIYTEANFLNKGDILDVEWTGMVEWADADGASNIYLSLYYVLRAAAVVPSGSPAILPGAGVVLTKLVDLSGGASTGIVQVILRGRLTVPSADLSTLDLYMYGATQSSSPTHVNVVFPNSMRQTLVSMRRPTQFRTGWV